MTPTQPDPDREQRIAACRAMQKPLAAEIAEYSHTWDRARADMQELFRPAVLQELQKCEHTRRLLAALDAAEIQYEVVLDGNYTPRDREYAAQVTLRIAGQADIPKGLLCVLATTPVQCKQAMLRHRTEYRRAEALRKAFLAWHRVDTLLTPDTGTRQPSYNPPAPACQTARAGIPNRRTHASHRNDQTVARASPATPPGRDHRTHRPATTTA